MKRWAWNSFCLFSLLVFASSVTLWVRSYFVWERFIAVRRLADSTAPNAPAVMHRYSVEWERGDVAFDIARGDFPNGYPALGGWAHNRDKPSGMIHPSRSTNSSIDYRLRSFQLQHVVQKQSGGQFSNWVVTAPLWFFLPAVLPPVLWWRKWRRQGGRGFPVLAAGTTGEDAPQL